MCSWRTTVSIYNIDGVCCTVPKHVLVSSIAQTTRSPVFCDTLQLGVSRLAAEETRFASRCDALLLAEFSKKVSDKNLKVLGASLKPFFWIW